MKTRVPILLLCPALFVLCIWPSEAPAQHLQIVEKIAFSSYRDGNFELYTISFTPDGTEFKRVTQSLGNDLWPSWSPDGRQIAFEESNRVYVINADGTGRRQLTFSAAGILDRLPSWSPDGSRVVFVSTRGGNADLYTMNPDGTDQRPLTNNPGVDTSPSWSPDSTKIAFLSERGGSYGLHVMDASGGNLRPLTGGTQNDGHISWSPDGKKIVFESRRTGASGIYVVDVDGANLKRLIPFDSLDLDFQPTWSPDGLRMAFMSVRPGNQEIYQMNADGTNPFRLTFNDGGGDLSKSQDILPSWASFRRIGVARVGAPVSRKMTVRNGDRVPLTVSNILSSDSQFTVSPTNFTLDFSQSREVTVTFTPSSGGFKHATLTLLSNDARSQAGALTVNGTGDATPPAAPTGLTAALAGNQQIALRWRANTDPDLSHYIVYRSASRGFTPGPADSVARVNKPDTTFTSAFGPGTHYFRVVAVDGVGNPSSASNEASAEVPVPLQPSDLLIAGRIAYASTGGAGSGIYAANPDGSDPRQITISPTSDAAPSWSPDGTKLAFYSSRDGNPDIYVVNADGTGQVRLTDHPAQDLYPSWSPDGTKIVFASNRDGNYEIYVMDANGDNPKRLTTHPGDDYWPAWSPDGTKIAFDSYRDDNFEIYVMDADGANPKQRTTHPELDREPSWSPDGTRIAFTSSRSGYPEVVYVMGADGSNPTPVSLTTRGSQSSWSPDGTKIAFIGAGGLSAMNLDGSVPAVVLPDAFSKSAPSWGEAFRHIGSAGVGASVSRAMMVQNRGTATLIVTGIASSDPQFTVAPASFSVSPGGSREVTVTFRPTSVGVKYATLTITSNDQTSPTARLTVNGGNVLFTDVAVAAGVSDGGDSHGVAWGDYDRDGDQDLYVANNGRIRLYRNDGQGRFTDATARAGMEDGGNGTGVAWGDYDNDGHLDLFAANNGENWLFRNRGDSTFTNVMRSARVNDRGTQTGAAWGDYNGDGYLDLYVASNDSPNRLYRNNRDGTFTNVADSAGVADTGNTLGVAWGDFDNDGDLDLYAVRIRQPNRLYRNNGNGTFTDVGTLAGVSDGAFGRSAAWGDFDNDGDLDLYVVNQGSNRLYRNNGNGTFTNTADSAGVADTGDGHGASWGDYDNDGDLDVYVVNNDSQHRLYRNNGDGKFTDIAVSSGISERGPGGFSAAWGDYDNDGDLDVYVAVSGRGNHLYRNAGNANRWLHVRLVGTASNRSGIGARVTAVTGGVRQRRDVDGGSGLFSQPSLPVEFGVGSAMVVDSLIVRWPGGIAQTLTNVATNQMLTVTEQVAPVVSVSPDSLAFGSVEVGGSAQRTLTVRNRGNAPLVITGVTVTLPFQAILPVPSTVNAGDSVNVTVTFLPEAEGIRADTLRIAHNATGGISKITLSGTGVLLEPVGTITTFAGTGAPGFAGENVPAIQARLHFPNSVALSAQGDVYIGDSRNYRIRRVNTTGLIATFAGTGGPEPFQENVPAAQASLNLAHTFLPAGVAVDTSGRVYIADLNHHRIRRVGADGVVTTFAGNGTPVFSGDGGPAAQAGLNFPSGVAVDAQGNVYIADAFNHRVRRVTPAGAITTFAGNGAPAFSGDGGPATQAGLNFPSGVAVDAQGNVTIADTRNNCIRRVTPAGAIMTVAGPGTPGMIGDGGPAIQAYLNTPYGLAVDGQGGVLIADTGNNRVRRLRPDGTIMTVAGPGTPGVIGDNGPATQAYLDAPYGVAVDAQGNVYIADAGNHRVRRVTPAGANRAPDLTVPGPQAVSEGGTLSFPVSATDPDGGDVVTISVPDLPRGATFLSGTFKWTPDFTQSGTYDVTFTARDSRTPPLSSQKTVRITVKDFVPAGQNVVSQPVDATTGATPVTMTFSQVTQPGGASLTTNTTGPPPPVNFALGTPPTFYDLSTTAVFAGPITVRITYTGVSYSNELSLRMFHFENNAWRDVTTSVDTTSNIISGVVSTLSPFGVFQATTPPPSGAWGDVNGDGRVTTGDATLVLRFSAGLEAFDETQRRLGDVNGDGGVNSGDATLILQKIVGLIQVFPREVSGKPAALAGRGEGVRFGPLRVVPERGIEVPVELGVGISGADLRLSYDASLYRIGQVKGPEGALVAVNPDRPGEVLISVARADAGRPDALWVTLEGWGREAVLGLSGEVFGADGLSLGPVEGRLDRPLKTALEVVYPNPFNPATTLRYALSESGEVRLTVYNLSGQVVRRLVSAWQAAGRYEAVWDGRNDRGREVSSGVYIGRLEAGEVVQTQKMLLLK